jgi:NAD(P)-dependent dehydrogenase (short-subunit alcohol dehydrogenase family)
MKQLQGKVAVVTGAASGIGRAVAGRCVDAGMRVVLADIEEGPLALAEKELAAAGGTVLAVPTDVSSAPSVAALAARALDGFGAVHLLHNNAGVAVAGPLWTCTLADWQWILGVNLWGVIHGIRTFVPIMLAQDEEGHIVNTASAAGLTSPPFMGPYNVTKHSVVTMSETLARELAFQQSKLRVSVLCPGFVNTGIASSERNRPADLLNEADAGPGAAPFGADMVRQMVESGIAPEVVADHVLDAVRHERFYILTHPELTGAVSARAEDIVTGRTPSLDNLFG